MNILIICPPTVPINRQSKYVGIERLTWEYSKQLIKQHTVTVLGNSLSEYPQGVKLLPITRTKDYQLDEIKQYQSYHYLLRNFDVIHDFSHLHLASRYNKNLPSLNIFWHAPSLAQYPKAPYNIIALSQWAARQFRIYYKQEARYQQSIGIDHNLYKISRKNRTDRLLAVARMGPEKGNFRAALICMEAKVPLDIIAARGLEMAPDAPLTDYEKSVIDICDGEKIKFLGDVGETGKIKYMQTCRALIYATNHPEVTSHKIQEFLFCGTPVIVPGIGAISEIVTHGVNGYLCDSDGDYLKAIKELDRLRPMELYDSVVEKYEISNVVRNYIPLYEEVKRGLRW